MESKNPFAIIDQILADWASPRARRLLHLILTLALALVSLWFAVEGDWVQFALALGAAIYTKANEANTPATPLESAYEGANSEPYGVPDPTFDTQDMTEKEWNEAVYGQRAPLWQPGSDETGFGGDAPLPGSQNG